MKRQTMKWTKLPLVSLVILAFASACADLASIRRFADTSAESAGYTSLTADYSKSIERQKRYQPARFHAELDQNIQKRKAQQPALLALHKGVAEYMSALGALASDELVSYDKSLSSLADELKGSNLIESSKADAFASLTKLIARAATDLYRQKELKRIIGESNEDFQKVVGAMSEIVGNDFIASLDNEAAAIDKYYREILVTSENAPPQHASVELLREKWLEKKEALEDKRQACALYSKTLSGIGIGHQMLFDNRNSLSSKQVLSTIKAYGKEISDTYNKIKDLN